MNKKKYQWYIPDQGETIEDAIEVETVWGEERLEFIAGEIASNYFHDYDGWEANWPVTFAICNMDGNELGTVEVHCESEPCFTSGTVSKP